MQNDGNLVLYGHAMITPADATWSFKTNTHSPTGLYRCLMQDNGNIVVYDEHKHPVWTSHTCYKGSAPYRLVVQDDGNLIIYDAHNKATWATNTNH
jgi:hypothetical protein